MITLLPYLGGLLSSWHGGNLSPRADKVWKNIAWTIPFTLAVAYFSPWFAPFTLLCLLKSMGHGRIYQPRFKLDLTKKPEKVEYLIMWLYRKIPDTAYKVLGMSLVGFAAVSGAVIGFGSVSLVAALFIIVGGLAKGLNAYLFNWNTEIREFADGVTAYSGLMAAILYLS